MENDALQAVTKELHNLKDCIAVCGTEYDLPEEAMKKLNERVEALGTTIALLE